MSKKSQARYREAGLCIFCGTEPPRPNRTSCEGCATHQAAEQKRRRAASIKAGTCVVCGGTPVVTRAHCEPCRDRHQGISKRRYGVIRDEVFQAYGGYVCACCGEKTQVFLTIDHIDGGGNTHRREIGNGNMYRWLRDHGFPPGFQVLCMNCQWGRMRCGVCPHQSSGTGEPQVTRKAAHLAVIRAGTCCTA